MDADPLAVLVRQQARACERLGSPLYARLLDRVADDVAAGGPAAAVLAGHEEDPPDSVLALRLAGTVHRLALAGQAPDLAAHYPSCGGDADPDAAWAAFRAVLAERCDDVRAGLAGPPQTNETGRAAPLLGALLHVAAAGSLPVRLWEIGASAGLNLRADRFGYRAADGGTWGPPASPVVLSPAWQTLPPALPRAVDVVERVGADPAPVDAASPAGELLLASYVWPDQVDRLRRLRAAVRVARDVPVAMVRAGAAELVSGLDLADGALTVVWHSVMWQYVDAGEQQEVLGRLEELGARAGSRSPLVHIAFEPPGAMFEAVDGFQVTSRTWPGGEVSVLGHAPPHGLPVTWSPATRS